MIECDVIKMMVGLTHDSERVKDVLAWIIEAKRLGAHLTPEAAAYALELFGEVFG